MARSLYQKLLKALYGTGTLSEKLIAEVSLKCLEIISSNESCKVALGSASVEDAVDYAKRLFLIGWKRMVKEASGMVDLRRKLTTLCINACQVQRRRSCGPLNLPMGGYVGTDFPSNVGSY